MKHVINRSITVMLPNGQEARCGYQVIHRNQLLIDRANQDLWYKIDTFTDRYSIYARLDIDGREYDLQ